MYTSTVKKGEQIGRTLDFPTINLDPKVIPSSTKQGVYASWVTIGTKMYKGALYFGPRLVFNETQNVLEIFIMDYSGDLYNQTVSFTIEHFIRTPKDFSNLNLLKQQLKKDIQDVALCLIHKA